MISVSLSKGEGLLVRSPFKVSLVSGDVRLWTFEFDNVTVNSGGIDVLFKAERDSEIEISGEFKKLSHPIPEWWDALAEDVVDRRIMFIGRVDSGKSSSTMYVASRLVGRGVPVSIIDADIGQSDLGPPGVIALKDLRDKFVHFKLIDPDKMYFVGDVSPRGHLIPMVVGVNRLSNSAGSSTVLLNTTGFVDGSPARILKRFKVEAYEPDLVVLVEKDEGDLAHIEKSLPPWVRVLKVRSPPEISIKTRGYRKSVRVGMLERFLDGSRELEVDLSVTRLLNTLLGTGDPKIEYSPLLEDLLGVKVEWVEEAPDSLVLLYRGELDYNRLNTLSRLMGKELRAASISDYKNLYVGLLNGMWCIGVGIMKDMDLKSSKALVKASVERFDSIALGYVRFDDAGNEVGKRPLSAP